MLVKAMEKKKQGSRIRKRPRKQRVIPKGCCFSGNVRNVRGLWIKNCNTKVRFFSKCVEVFGIRKVAQDKSLKLVSIY